jgi:hypothetical protein
MELSINCQGMKVIIYNWLLASMGRCAAPLQADDKPASRETIDNYTI